MLKASFFALLLLIPVPSIAARSAADKAAHRPNIEISLYRRNYTPGEAAPLRISAYNTHKVQLSASRLDLGALTPTSKAMEDFAKRLKALHASRLPVTKRWTFNLGKIEPDAWEEREPPLPLLPPGVYLLRAVSGDVEKRTWFAITDIALLAKRSRQAIVVYAANATTGRPIPALSLTATDETGRRQHGVTDIQGIWRVASTPPAGNLWVIGEQKGRPAFVISGLPAAPDAYSIYTFTDRPIYRPGHKVLFKSTLRERLEAAAPGGFTYRPYANRTALVEIRDPTDALIYQRELKTNAYGSLDGDIQLAGDTALGQWQLVTQIGDFRSYSNFDVEAYRKPEMIVSVTTEATHFPGGTTIPVLIDAKYYFGGPAAKVPVKYSVSFQSQGYGVDVETAYAGEGQTDINGQLKIQVKTDRRSVNRIIIVNTTVTDLSRRSQVGTGSVLVTAAAFRLFMETDARVYQPGDPVKVTVRAVDYDDKPVSTPVHISMIETRYKWVIPRADEVAYQEITRRTVQTGAGGSTTVIFTPVRPGTFQFNADAIDPQQVQILAGASILVAGDDIQGYEYPTLSLLPERNQYRPGEMAVVVLNTSLINPHWRRPKEDTDHKLVPPPKEAWALITVEGERLYRQWVIHLSTRSTTFRVPLDGNGFPAVYVHATILLDKQVYDQQVQVAVERKEQKLQVAVQSEKEKYSPGETASYTVTTRDYTGHPVPAEVALSVVDASIYDVRPDSAPEIEGFFYPPQTERVQTDFSFAGQYSGGAFQTVPSSAAAGKIGSDTRVRRHFADTAFWNASLITGPNGSAKVSFELPDNLTSWRATARGITTTTQVGASTHDVLSSMPLLVRLEMPRFYVQNDEAVVSAVIHNYTGEARSVQTRIETTGAEMEGAAQGIIRIGPNEQQRVDWKAKIVASGRPLAAGEKVGGDTARFLVYADAGVGAKDAMELTLPVSQDGLKMVQVKAGSLSLNPSQQKQDLTQLPPGATLKVTLSPSIASAMFDSLDYLTSYPYGCAEQTMSSFLPDVVVQGTLRRLGVEHKVQPDLDRWVSLGLQKLYRYQHPDGGWQWWEFDQTDGDMTAYILWGLIQARDAGYVVDEQRIVRGAAALRNLLNNERDLSNRAEWLYPLACLEPQTTIAPLTELFKKRAKLDTYSQATLCLALAEAARRLSNPPTVVPTHPLTHSPTPPRRRSNRPSRIYIPGAMSTTTVVAPPTTVVSAAPDVIHVAPPSPGSTTVHTSLGQMPSSVQPPAVPPAGEISIHPSTLPHSHSSVLPLPHSPTPPLSQPTPFTEMASTVAHELDARAEVHGTTAYWPAEEGGYSWYNDDAAVTAHVLRAILAADPQSQNIQPAVRWLMANRTGKAWSSTRTSAEVVFALSEYLERTNELHPAFRGRVTLDGQTVTVLDATSKNALDPPLILTLGPDQLAGHKELAIDKTGAGALYVTSAVSYVLPPAEAHPLSKGISVRRTYRLTAEDPSQADSINSGRDIDVAVEITADANYRYAMLEDPLPAGCEVTSNTDEMGRLGFLDSYGSNNFARQEIRDDKIVFFFNDLPKGRRVLNYRLHAETPGLYHILPSIASLVYFPEVRGNSGLVGARIKDEK